MATKKTDTAVMSPEQHAEAVRQMMEKLRQPSNSNSKPLLDRLAEFGQAIVEKVTDVAVDQGADSGETGGRFGAAAHSAVLNMRTGYEMEMERQLRRRAERVIKQQQKLLG